MRSWTKFRTKFVNASLDLLWQQWSTLGIQTTGEETRTSVDLDALLVGTWSVGRVDPRLFDAGLSWCCEHGGLIHHKRLKKLVEQVDDEEVSTVGTAWGRLVESKRKSGRSWYESDQPLSEPDQALFLDKELQRESELHGSGTDIDSHFDSVGWRRAQFVARDDFQAPKLRKPENLQLFCRRFFGTGRRSEVMTPLLLGFGLTTAELADWTLYSQRSVQMVLRELKETDLLDWEGGRGRSTPASLSDEFRAALQKSIAPRIERKWTSYLQVRNWSNFYSGLVILWRAVRTITQRNYHGFKGQSILRDALEDALEYHGRASTHTPYHPNLSVSSFEELLGEAHTYLDVLFPNLESASR